MPLFKNTVSPANLISGCIRNDRKCQEMLYKQHAENMLAICFTYTKNKEEAILILQVGFLKIFKNISRFNPLQSSLNQWMKKCIQGSAIAFLKQNKKGDVSNKLEQVFTQNNNKLPENFLGSLPKIKLKA